LTCQPKKEVDESSKRTVSNEVRLAKRFNVERSENAVLITIDKPWQGSNSALRYLLYADSIPQVYEDSFGIVPIKVPVTSLVSNSTTHLSYLEELGVENILIGFSQSQYIYSEKILSRLQEDEVKEIGADGKLDVEYIVDLNPDIVLAFNAGTENRQLKKLQELGLQVVMNADYMETSVLGRYEWIKFLGHFTGQIDQANERFDQMVIRYDSLKSMCIGVEMPTVISGTLYGGSWFLPGGKNYGSQIIADAGGNYLWKTDDSSGWLNLDFEAVYEKAWQADYWIGVSNYESLAVLKESVERYADFEAFKKGNVYTYTARVNANGANDYFESGNVNPDRILADHIKILHPELLPNYELYYYKKLK
jgi:iron complex transport system substrate-binding protein